MTHNRNHICISKKIVLISAIVFFFTSFMIAANFITSNPKVYKSSAKEMNSGKAKVKTSFSSGEVKSGTLNVYTIIVDFDKNPNPETIESVQAKYATVNSFYTFAANAKLSINSKIVKTAKLNETTIKGVYQECTNADHVKRWMANIKKDTYDLDVNKNSYPVIVFNFPWGDKCSNFTFDAVTPGLRDHIYINGPMQFNAYAHELGHYTSLGHANFLFCNGVTVPTSATACSIQPSDDPFNIMGRHFTGQFNGVMKAQNGWLSSSIETFQKYFWQKKAQKDFTLNAIETISTKTQVIKIPKSDLFYGDAYYIEYRYPVLYDDTTPLPPSGGVIVYMKQTQVGAKDDTLLMDVHPQTKFGFDSIKNARLISGEVFDDSLNKIKITVLSIDTTARTASVRIELY